MEKKEDLRVETNMTDGELICMMCYTHPQMNVVAGWRSLANRSIRRAIEDQQVVPIEEVQEVARELTKQREMRLAEAVHAACLEYCIPGSASWDGVKTVSEKLGLIVAEVK